MQGATPRVSDNLTLRHIYVEVRRPRGLDPGQVEEAKWAETDDGCVQLYAMSGRSFGKKFKRQIVAPLTARETAALLLRSLLRGRGSDFSRRLTYPPGY
jgi:hypothetical protein